MAIKNLGFVLLAATLAMASRAATIAVQGFESSSADTWAFFPEDGSNNALSTFGNGTSSTWGPASFLANSTFITPYAGSQLWGIRSTNNTGAGGTPGLQSLRFAPFDLRAFTDVTLSFRVQTSGVEPTNAVSGADIWHYQVFVDGSFGAEVALPLNSRAQDGGWAQIEVPIADSASSAAVRFQSRFDSFGDYAAIDDVRLTGTVLVPEPAVLSLAGVAMLSLGTRLRRQCCEGDMEEAADAAFGR